MNRLNLTADVIVVGSGPGGATVSKKLIEGGKKVLLLERGGDHRSRFYYGTYPGALLYSEKMSFLFTEEGVNIVAPNMLGGATSMFCGCASPPPEWFKSKYNLDIDTEVKKTLAELDIRPLPDHQLGTASTRIAQAAKTLGYSWYRQPKFMFPAKRKNIKKDFNCGASCMLGCSCGAKWNAAEWVDDAAVLGAVIKTRAKVERILIENGQVVGVEGKLKGKMFTAKSETVIISAGGLGSPRILQKSGFEEAGQGMTMDSTVMVYGFTSEKGTGNEPPMTWSFENDPDGYMSSTLTDPWLLYPLIAIKKGIGPALRWFKWNRMHGIMIKLKDDISGGVFANGKISKYLTKSDQERLDNAYQVCRRILIEVGANKKTIFMTPIRGTHPSGTVRIDEMLDNNLQTNVKGLYVCDASVFPESLDRPTVLTIIGLGKRLASHILAL